MKALVVNKGFIAKRGYEKRWAKNATLMLATFLENVLRENATILSRNR